MKYIVLLSLVSGILYGQKVKSPPLTGAGTPIVPADTDFQSTRVTGIMSLARAPDMQLQRDLHFDVTAGQYLILYSNLNNRSGGRLVHFNPANRRRVSYLAGDFARSNVFALTQGRIVIGNPLAATRVYDYKTKKQLGALPAKPIVSMTVASDGIVWAACPASNKILEIDPVKLTQKIHTDHGIEKPSAILALPDQKALLIGKMIINFVDPTPVYRYEAGKGPAKEAFRIPGKAYLTGITSDGCGDVIVPGASSHLYRFRLSDGKRALLYESAPESSQVRYSSERNQLMFVEVADEGGIHFLDLKKECSPADFDTFTEPFYPGNGWMRMNPLQPELRWSEVRNARYELVLSEDKTFRKDSLLFRSASSSARLPPLKENTGYYWRVRAINAAGPGRWSVPFHFVNGTRTDHR